MRAPARGAGRERQPLLDRADVGDPFVDLRVERLGRCDCRLDRGEAGHTLGDRGVADLGGVADGAGAGRRGVDDEANVATRDEVEECGLAFGRVRVGAELGDGIRLEPGCGDRRPRARRRREAEPRTDERGGESWQLALVTVGDREERHRDSAARPPPWPPRTTRPEDPGPERARRP